jgi:murein DD-endopeptidase MepM/ murein hydrolase activator NlpD
MSLGALGVLAIVAMVFSLTTLVKSVNISRLEELQRRNDVLARELTLTRELIGRLNDTVAAITERDLQVRQLAGLPPTDPDVRLAGIGGPVGDWAGRAALLAEGKLGQEALNIRLDVGSLNRRASLLARSFHQAAESLRAHVDRLSHTPSIKPTLGWLSSNFSRERLHPVHHEPLPHEGIDLSADMGAPILAPAGGIVTDVRQSVPGYGRLVTIDHGYGVVTRYAHMSRILVRIGQRVKRNEQIALVGNAGIATGPHLHYEVIVNGRHVDPLGYILPERIVD